MSARIPHLLTRLLSSAECDTFRDEMLAKAAKHTGSARKAWMEAATLFETHRNAAFFCRHNQTPSARRKSLGVRSSLS